LIPSDHDLMTPELLLDPTVKTLAYRPLPVSDRFVGRHRHDFLAPGILINQGDMSQGAANFINLSGILRSIHQIVKIIYPLARHLHQGNGDLTIRHRNRG